VLDEALPHDPAVRLAFAQKVMELDVASEEAGENGRTGHQQNARDYGEL
jgi:hypothetical protein